jgi:Caspase domain
MRTVCLTILLSSTLSAALGQSPNGTRFALVIGAQNYPYVQPLNHSLNDAADMAVALKAKGFSVETLYDLKQKKKFRMPSSGIMRQ